MAWPRDEHLNSPSYKKTTCSVIQETWHSVDPARLQEVYQTLQCGIDRITALKERHGWVPNTISTQTTPPADALQCRAPLRRITSPWKRRRSTPATSPLMVATRTMAYSKTSPKNSPLKTYSSCNRVTSPHTVSPSQSALKPPPVSSPKNSGSAKACISRAQKLQKTTKKTCNRQQSTKSCIKGGTVLGTTIVEYDLGECSSDPYSDPSDPDETVASKKDYKLCISSTMSGRGSIDDTQTEVLQSVYSAGEESFEWPIIPPDDLEMDIGVLNSDQHASLVKTMDQVVEVFSSVGKRKKSEGGQLSDTSGWKTIQRIILPASQEEEEEVDVDESDKEEDTEEVEETEAFSHLDSLRATSTYSPWTDKENVSSNTDLSTILSQFNELEVSSLNKLQKAGSLTSLQRQSLTPCFGSVKSLQSTPSRKNSAIQASSKSLSYKSMTSDYNAVDTDVLIPGEEKALSNASSDSSLHIPSDPHISPRLSSHLSDPHIAASFSSHLFTPPLMSPQLAVPHSSRVNLQYSEDVYDVAAPV